MGFNVSVVTEIMKFPWPLYPKFKYIYPLGVRFEIPSSTGLYEFEIELPKVELELQSIVFAQTNYRDGDYYSLLKNDEYILKNIYIKDNTQTKEIRPIVYINPLEDSLKFVYNNNTGTSKIVYLDFDFASIEPVKEG